VNKLSTAAGVIILLLALGAIAQQGGAPTRGAGSGGSGATAATTYGGTYGYTWGSTRRCVIGRFANQPFQNGLDFARNGCSCANTYPASPDIGNGHGFLTPDASLLAVSARCVCDGIYKDPNTLVAIRSTGGGVADGIIWRGNDAGARLGGFHVWMRWFRTVGANTNTVFAGIRNMKAAYDTTWSEFPLAFPDSVFMYCAVGGTNYSICSNDQTEVLDGGTATYHNGKGYENAQCTTLGPNFPCATSSDGGYGYGNTGTEGSYYDLILTADPSADIMTYYVKDLRTNAVASGTLTSRLPTNTAFLNYQIAANNGNDGGITTLGFSQVCFTTK
jgi:hypothetical protein